MADRPGLHRVEDVEELRVDRRLAAGKLDEVGLALAGDQRIEHGLDLGQGAVAAVDVGGIGKAHRAGEVAGAVDLHDGKARMLLVIGAQPAVERTAGLGSRLGEERPVAGFEPQLLCAPVFQIIRDQSLLYAVLQTSLEVENPPSIVGLLDDDLGGHGFEAGFAQRCRLAVEHIGRGFAGGDIAVPDLTEWGLRQHCLVATRHSHRSTVPPSACGTGSARPRRAGRA